MPLEVIRPIRHNWQEYVGISGENEMLSILSMVAHVSDVKIMILKGGDCL